MAVFLMNEDEGAEEARGDGLCILEEGRWTS